MMSGTGLCGYVICGGQVLAGLGVAPSCSWRELADGLMVDERRTESGQCNANDHDNVHGACIFYDLS